MRATRRLLQVVALAGTLLVGVVALSLIVSQTPWFKDWLRRFIVRESKQYLNGELSIGRLGGNLFFGVQLSDVALDVSGERVVAIKGLVVDYSIIALISEGTVLDGIRVIEPRLRLERDPGGWNVGQLVRTQRREADREGPARPITLRSIEIVDGSLDVVDAEGENGEPDAYDLPSRIEDLDVRASFAYAPVHYTIRIDHLGFRGHSPDIVLEQLAGTIAIREDNLYLEDLSVRTADSSIAVDGVIERYLKTPAVKLTSSGKVSLPEIGRVVPAVSGYALQPAFDVKANGPADRLAIDLDVRSEAGHVRGLVTADVQGPRRGVAGSVAVERLNLAPILKNPRQRSDITGKASFDLAVADAGEAPLIDRLSGTYRFEGPRVVAAGYEASGVRAAGAFREGRITLDARAAAYGGTATASGFVAPATARRPLAFNLKGQADNVNLRGLPDSTRAPGLDTMLSVAEYQVEGAGRTVKGWARLNRSDIEGATIAEGTVAEFATGPGQLTYAARGGVEHLDLPRLGRALNVEALGRPELDGSITGTFDVRGSGTTLETLTLDASGVLTDTTLMGARLRGVSFETRLADRALDATVKGAFAELDPARLAGNRRLEGIVSGSVDARVRFVDLAEPITPQGIAASGRVVLGPSQIAGLQIDAADVRGAYDRGVGDIEQLTVKGPDLSVEAAGRLALDRTSESNLKYRIETTDLAELGRLAGQTGVDGGAILEGTLTGNAAALRTSGTLDATNLAYQDHKALAVQAKYAVSVPQLMFADATVDATTTATFVQVGGVTVSEVEATTTYRQKTLAFSARLQEQTRELDATGQVIFHPDHQEIHLPSFTIKSQGQEWTSAAGTEAAVQYGGGMLTLQNVNLVSGDQRLGLEGTLALGEDRPAGTLQVKASNVDLAKLEQLLMQNRGLSGRLSADATLTGTARSPVVDGRVEIVQGGFQRYKYESLVADVDYRGTRIELDARLQQSATEAITARGTVPLSLFRRSEPGHVSGGPEDRVDVHVVSTNIDLGLVQGLTTAVTNVTGTVQADVRVTGSGQDPHLEGYVDIRNGAFGVPLGGVSYSGLDTRIELSPDVVRIREFKIADEHGETLTVSGQLAVHERQVGAVDITLTSDNFEILDNALGDVGVDTQLKITGELRRPRVEGQVRIEAGRLEVDQVLQLFYDPYSVSAVPAVVSAERTVEGSGSAEEATRQALARAGVASRPKAEGGAEPTVRAGAFAPVELDVQLVIPDNLVLRGNDLRPGGPTRAAIGDMNITVGGDLQVRKQAGGPLLLTGVVETIRGTYQFQGRRFDLVRGGTLRFTGDTDINPILDVAATRLISDTGVEARVQVTGTVRTPEIRLSSTPPLEESDVLAMIVFNRPVNELGTGERASLAATAGGIATGFIAAPLGESIGRALDVDIFEITTTTDTGELGAGITIGQQIGDRAFFKLRQQFGDRNVSEFLLEYQLADFLRLRASAAPETSGSANRVDQRRVERAGIDLIFFFSY